MRTYELTGKQEFSFGIGYYEITNGIGATTMVGISKAGNIVQNMWNLPIETIKQILKDSK